MGKITNKELIIMASDNISEMKRYFKKDKKGHFRGAGLKAVRKTRKMSSKNSMVLWHTLADGRRLCYTVQIVGS